MNRDKCASSYQSKYLILIYFKGQLQSGFSGSSFIFYFSVS